MKKIVTPLLGLTALMLMSFAVKKENALESPDFSLSEIANYERVEDLGSSTKTETDDKHSRISTHEHSTWVSFLRVITHTSFKETDDFVSKKHIIITKYQDLNELSLLLEKYN